MNPLDMMVTDLNAEYMGLPRLSLMENAGSCLAQHISSIAGTINPSPKRVIIFTGSGGNGGDGLVAGRHLLNYGYEVEIFLLNHPCNFRSSQSQSNYIILENMSVYAPGLKINYINDSKELDEFIIKDIDNSVVVDSILGTGIEGKLREPSRSAIKLINRMPGIKIAVDIPSGLNPLNGKIEDLAVKANYTITFHKVKTGLDLNSEYTGKIRICDIGIPEHAELFLGKGDLLRIKKRNPDAHKGANGRIMVLGGSKDYTGAPALAGLSALNTGADLVYVLCPESAALPLKSYSPDLIVRGLEGEVIHEGMVDDILEMAHKVDCVLMGCGASQDKQTGKTFNYILEKMDKPLVLDADALKLVKKDIVKNYEDLIVTPHSSEFNAFFREEVDFNSTLEEKIKALKNITPTIKGTVLLKGRVDVIMQQDHFRLNKTGSPGMTVGGTGDCLAGVVANLRAQGISIFDAGCLGAFINGRAGEIAEKKYGPNFTAAMMIPLLAEAMQY